MFQSFSGREDSFPHTYPTIDHFLPKIRQNELDEKRRHFLRERRRGRRRERGSEHGEDEDRKRKYLRLEPFLFEIVSLLSDSRVAFMSVLCII